MFTKDLSKFDINQWQELLDGIVPPPLGTNPNQSPQFNRTGIRVDKVRQANVNYRYIFPSSASETRWLFGPRPLVTPFNDGKRFPFFAGKIQLQAYTVGAIANHTLGDTVSLNCFSLTADLAIGTQMQTRYSTLKVVPVSAFLPILFDEYEMDIVTQSIELGKDTNLSSFMNVEIFLNGYWIYFN